MATHDTLEPCVDGGSERRDMLFKLFSIGQYLGKGKMGIKVGIAVAREMLPHCHDTLALQAF